MKFFRAPPPPPVGLNFNATREWIPPADPAEIPPIDENQPLNTAHSVNLSASYASYTPTVLLPSSANPRFPPTR